ncbi:MAG: LacI family DNA-binding transcriptional regulator [Victivallaceae bacterium]|nr:LacI family DNA-binding transcriptional regulator [Victivallaceae bacterium]
MVTIKKIAQELNLSPATVSLALNGSPLVAAKTRERVKAVADRLDYVPNNFGRGLQSRQSRLIGYICSSVRNSFNGEVIEAAGRTAAENDYGVLIGVAGGQCEYFDQELQLFLEKHVDGILLTMDWVFDGKKFSEFIRKVTQRGIPVILVATDAVDCPFPVVNTDNFRGGYLACEHLAKLGHRKLCYSTDSAPQHRADGYIAAAKDYGVELVSYPYWSELIDGIVHDRGFTGVLCNSDYSGIDMLSMLRRLGYRIPADISVMGFDDVWYAAHPEFNLSTVAQQRGELGRLAMDSLLRSIKTEAALPPVQLVEPRLVVRDSTGAAIAR